jgi:phosphoribosylformylglycinamidine cyclo-ligase
MYKVFNMGHRMEIYVEPELAGALIEISQSFHIDARVVGRVEPFDGKKLIIRSEFGTFEY